MVQQNSPYNTLTPEDQIDGGADAENHLQVTVRSDFENGFKTHVNEAGETVSNLQNVQQIELINPNNQQYVFDGQNTEGVKTWVLNNNSNQTGSLDLTDLPVTGIAVDILGQKSGAANIGFNADAVKGDSDAMTIGLENVGTSKTVVNLNTKAVEELAIVSNGAANWIDISRFDSAENLTVSGAGDLTIIPSSATVAGKTSLPEPLKTIDASSATGDITVHTSTIYARATYHGGSGDDTLYLDGPTAGNYMLHMDSVENLTIKGNTSAITFDATNVNGVDTLNIIDSSAKVSFVHANQEHLDANVNGPNASSDVNIQGANDVDVTITNVIYANTMTLDDATDVTVTLNPAPNASAQFNGILLAPDATVLTLNTGSNGTFGFGRANYGIKAPNVTDLTINTGSSESGILIGDNTAGTNPNEDLTGVQNLVITGNSASVRLNVDPTIASDSNNLNVNAGQLNTGSTTGFLATFAGSDNTAQITVTGAATGTNHIIIGETGATNFDEQITVVGSADADTIELFFANAKDLMNLVEHGVFDIDLGTGINSVTITGPGAAWATSNADDAAKVAECITGDNLTITYA